VTRPLLAGTVMLLSIAGLRAQEAAKEPAGEPCLTLNNQVLGPRSPDRPLPLLAGDPEHGLRPACAVTWSKLSPNNQPLAVLGCFQGNLLQVANDAACGRGTGMLWVNSRWVVTSADARRPQQKLALCQQLETGAWAGTRAFSFDCVPREKEKPPADGATADKPAANPSHPDPQH
jgi:hypothetical protein